VKKYIVERLKEQSTWRGLVLLATAAGIPVAPAQAEAIIAVGMAIVGAINVFSAEKISG
jgi:hypothetical protein